MVAVQATSKKAISKMRMPVGAACLITARTYVRHISDATSLKRRRSQTTPTVSTTDAPIQKCPEVIPWLPGLNVGRANGAGSAPAPGLSMTTPSSGADAQAESTHAITKASIPHHAACLFTKPNLLIAEVDATSGARGLTLKKGVTKKFCAEREARV